MPIDPEATLRRAEDVLARYGGSAQAIAAQKRRVGRAAGELGRRVGRSVAAMSATGVGLAGYGLLGVGVVGIDLLIAGMFALPAVGAGVLMIPTRRAAAPPAKLAQVALGRLAADAEEWLVRERPQLPRPAARATDAILTRLHELQPQLARLKEGDPEAGEARRLIGQHLPRLIEAWAAVPPAARAGEAEAQLSAGLSVVATELGRLGEGLAKAKLTGLAVEQRFLEARYQDGPAAPPTPKV